jgi:hypothetical protein
MYTAPVILQARLADAAVVEGLIEIQPSFPPAVNIIPAADRAEAAIRALGAVHLDPPYSRLNIKAAGNRGRFNPLEWQVAPGLTVT